MHVIDKPFEAHHSAGAVEYRLRPRRAFRNFLVVFCLVAGTWMLILPAVMALILLNLEIEFSVGLYVGFIPFVFVGVFIQIVGYTLWRGSMRIIIDGDTLTAVEGVGPFRWKQSRQLSSIRAFEVREANPYPDSTTLTEEHIEGPNSLA